MMSILNFVSILKVFFYESYKIEIIVLIINCTRRVVEKNSLSAWLISTFISQCTFNDASPFKRSPPIVNRRYYVFSRRNVENDFSLVVEVTSETDITRNIL